MTNTVAGVTGQIVSAFGTGFDTVVAVTVIAMGIVIALGLAKAFFGRRPKAG